MKFLTHCSLYVCILLLNKYKNAEIFTVESDSEFADMVGTFPFYVGSMLVYIICLVGKGMIVMFFFCLFVRETWFSVRCSFS